MRIFITGVTGQLGTALISTLSDQQVIAADRKMLDLGRPREVGPLLDRILPELIINPAAYTAVDKAETDSELAARINRDAPEAFATWASRRKVPLVHFSTDYVFDGSGQKRWQEDDPTGPLSVYGTTKLAGEHAIQAAGGPHLIIRTSWVYAARGANFMRTIARLAREKKELRIVADEFGAPTSAASIAVLVKEMLAEGLGAFCTNLEKADGLIHFTAAGETTWHEFAQAIIEGLRTRGVDLAIEQVHSITAEQYGARAKRPKNSRLDCSRCIDVFGVSPPYWRSALDIELDVLAKDLLEHRHGLSVL